jgi:DNA-binding response OmpR family regulator
VFSPARATPGPDAIHPLKHLGTHERAVLAALADAAGKVVSRRELARRIGVQELSERRCDSILVGVRRVLGPDAIRTVRSRGWMLHPSALADTTLLLCATAD